MTATWQYYIELAMKKKRTHYNTTLEIDLLKKLKFLAVEVNSRQNDLLEEAIQDLLNKYENYRSSKAESQEKSQ